MPTDPSNPFKLSFTAAIAWFRRRISIPSKDWKTIHGEDQNYAFSVSSIQNAEMLSDIRSALDRYIADGTGFNQFSKDFYSIAERYGWQPKQGVAWRANIVASTNLRQAYAAGQAEQRQKPEVRALRPGLKWVWRDSPCPRPHHLAMDGKVFDANDPVVQGVSLPQGFGCRCRWMSSRKPDDGYFTLSDRLALTLPSGNVVKVGAVPVEGKLYPIAEPGFYRPTGVSRQAQRVEVLRGMIARQPEELQAKILAQLPEDVRQAIDA